MDGLSVLVKVSREELCDPNSTLNEFDSHDITPKNADSNVNNDRPSPRIRSSITNYQRIQICAKKKEFPGITQGELKTWAKLSLGIDISQAVISATLKRSDELLKSSVSGENGVPMNLNVKRRRKVAYEDVNLALREWILREHTSIDLTSNKIRDQACKIFQKMYPNEPARRFSNGWFECFISRHDMKKYLYKVKKDSTEICDVERIPSSSTARYSVDEQEYDEEDDRCDDDETYAASTTDFQAHQSCQASSSSCTNNTHHIAKRPRVHDETTNPSDLNLDDLLSCDEAINCIKKLSNYWRAISSQIQDHYSSKSSVESTLFDSALVLERNLIIEKNIANLQAMPNDIERIRKSFEGEFMILDAITDK